MTGLRVPPGDSAALARTILDLLRDPEGAQRLGASGREVIRREFDPEAEARNLVTVYHALSNARPEPSTQVALMC